MKVFRKSSLTGKTHSLELDVTIEQLERFKNRIDNGEYIQTIFPNLTKEFARLRRT
jgi:hypothetical protein